MNYSPVRNPIVAVVILITILVSSSLVLGAEIRLAWDSNTDPDLAGYKVYYGTASRTYGSPVNVGNVTSYSLAGLTQGQTYFIAVTACDTSNNESAYSNEVSGMASQPPPAYIAATVNTNPPGLRVIVDQATQATPVTFVWGVGSSHILSAPSPENGAPGTQYVYVSWSDGGAQSHTITVPLSSTTYTASFKTQYSLTTSVNPIGGGTVTPSGTTWYDSGRVVSVSAVANSGFAFTGWSGDLSPGAANPSSITLNGPLNVAANFSTASPKEPTVGPDLTGSWITPVTQTCKKLGPRTACSVRGNLAINNIGNQGASSSYVTFYLSNNGTFDGGDSPLKSVPVGSIEAGSSKTVQLTTNLSRRQTATGKYIVAVTDARGSVTETNEANNIISSGPIP